MSRPEIRIPSFGQFGSPRLQGTAIGAILLIIVILWIAVTSFFTVEPEEIGLVLRFGQFVRTTDPGLHFKFPTPLERVIKVPVQRQLKQEFGFRTETAGIRTRYSQRDLRRESLMLTGDLNVAVVEWSVQYRINDPRAYLFKVRDPETTFRDVSEAVMRTVVGDHSVDEVVTSGRDKVAIEAQAMLQDLLNRYEMGISILQLVPQDVNPPDPVKPAFNEVNQAIQEKEMLENQAEAEYNRAIPLARGQAAQRVSEAEGSAEQRVNEAKGDVSRFLAVLAEYRKAPGVTRERLWQETLQQVISNTGNRVVVDRNLQGLIPLLNLGERFNGPAGAAKKEGGR
jgi:membrane protease subunit HflK